MSEAKTYLQDNLSEKVPQKIIAHLIRTDIDRDEKVVAVFGSASFGGISSSLLSTEDRLIYVNTSGFVARTTVILYSDLTDVSLKTEGKNQYIYLECSNGDSIKLDINASAEEIQKILDFLTEYKESGINFIKQKLLEDKNYALKVDAIQHHKNIKTAQIHWIHDEKRAEQHRANMEKIDMISSRRLIQHYELDYVNGLEGIFQPCTVKITLFNQIMSIKSSAKQCLDIPFADIKASTIKTDAVASSSNKNDPMMFYLIIDCIVNGKDCSIVFSKKQKADLAKDPIRQLNDSLHHLAELTERSIERNARYDEREQRLLAQREQLLAQRSAQIEHLHEIINPGSNTATPRSTGTPELTAVPQNTSSNLPSPASAADEIKNFKALLDEGILTQEEFDAKKKQLLNL